MVSAFSIPKAPRNCQQPKRPGPGHYNPQKSPRSYQPKNPSYSFSRCEVEMESKGPGPGAYQIKSSIFQKNSPSYSIKLPLKPSRAHFSLGPAYYSPSLKNHIHHQPCYSIRTKLQQKDPSGPGPGNYDMPQIQNKGYHIGKQSKFYQPGNKVPGPGSYQAQQISIKCKTIYDPKYSFRTREPDRISLVPGPGHYSPANQTYNKIGGIISKDVIQFSMTCKSPSLNYYQRKKEIKKMLPSQSMPKVNRDIQLSIINNGSGHNDFDRKCRRTMKLQPSHKLDALGSKTKLNIAQLNGQGTQKVVNDTKSRKHKLRQIFSPPTDDNIHAPEIYDSVNVMRQTWVTGKGKYRVGRQARLKNTITITPGPGAYNHSPSNGQSHSPVMGKDQKLKPIKSVAPGPGHYILQSTFADVPKYLLQRR